jgi:plasmid stability protein
MTTYVVALPGTLLGKLGPDARAELLRELSPADPRHTTLGENEDLDRFTLDEENSTFVIRLEVQAATTGEAETEARRIATAALASAGLDENSAPMGPAAISGIDTE